MSASVGAVLVANAEHLTQDLAHGAQRVELPPLYLVEQPRELGVACDRLLQLAARPRRGDGKHLGGAVAAGSRKATSLRAASSTSSACSVAWARPPGWPRVPIERMNTPGSRKWSARRMRSPSSAPCVNGLEGSTVITPTVVSPARTRA